MRLIKYLVLAIIAIGLVVVALANRGSMTLHLLPSGIADFAGLEYQLTLPVFVVLLAIFLLGLLFGFVWEWLREHKHRVTARNDQRERERLEKEVHKIAPPTDKGDDVLAILDGR